MTVAILIVLAAVWAWVLLPPHLARRRDAHPQSSVVSFRRQLAVLERTGPGSVGTYGYGPVGRSGMSRREARKRRRDIFFTLLAGVVLTFAMAVLMGGSVWILHLSVDVLFLGFVAVLASQAQVAAERTAKVRYLPQQRRPAPAAQQLLLRRSGS